MSLRGRLTFAFGTVALVAVALACGLTLVAALRAQDRLVTEALARMHPGTPPGVLGAMVADMGLDPGRALMDGMGFGTVAGGVIAAVVAAVAAALVARRLTAPLAELAVAARRLEAGERGLRLPAPGSRDEVAALTVAFNGLVAGLERQETLRRELVADVAHDLRTPLAVLAAEMAAMRDGLMPLDLDRLDGEVRLLARLVDDLRTLSLAEGGGLELRPEVVELGPLLVRTAGALASQAEAAGSSIELVAVEPGLAATLDPDAVARLLRNLLENAVRHGGPGRIELGAERSGADLRLWVRDRGPGLSPESLIRAFDRLYRADQSRSRATGGSGLGLAIARALAEAQGGRLEAANHPEGGAVFAFQLPGAVPWSARPELAAGLALPA